MCVKSSSLAMPSRSKTIKGSLMPVQYVTAGKVIYNHGLRVAYAATDLTETWAQFLRESRKCLIKMTVKKYLENMEYKYLKKQSIQLTNLYVFTRLAYEIHQGQLIAFIKGSVLHSSRAADCIHQGQRIAFIKGSVLHSSRAVYCIHQGQHIAFIKGSILHL